MFPIWNSPLKRKKEKRCILKLNKIFWFGMTGLYLTDCREPFQITRKGLYLCFHWKYKKKKKNSEPPNNPLTLGSKPHSLSLGSCSFPNPTASLLFWNAKRTNSTLQFWPHLFLHSLFFCILGLFSICLFAAAGCHSFSGAALLIWKDPESLRHILSLNLPFLFLFSLSVSWLFRTMRMLRKITSFCNCLFWDNALYSNSGNEFTNMICNPVVFLRHCSVRVLLACQLKPATAVGKNACISESL